MNMKTNTVVAEYDYYTLDQAAEILEKTGLYTLDRAETLIHERDIQAARGEARKRQNRWNAKHEEERARREYFCKQRFYGLLEVMAVLLITLIIGNYAFGAMALPGICLMCSRKMLLINDYYWTHGGDRQWK